MAESFEFYPPPRPEFQNMLSRSGIRAKNHAFDVQNADLKTLVQMLGDVLRMQAVLERLLLRHSTY